MSLLKDFVDVRKKYDKIQNALSEVDATGYGIVMPTIDELTLEEPEIIKQGGKYGVRLKASAPSIHLMKANIVTEVNPIVGSEKQSEELVMYLLNEFEESPQKLWESNIFGKSLHELVNEGLHNKLYRMPVDARLKLQETIERIINEGCGGLICFIL
jgi:stage IV sporulation protein A